MDIEALVLRVVRDAVARFRYRMPMRTAAVGANGAVLFSEFTPAPLGSPKGSITQEHVTGKIPDAGFESPIHVMITDATGRATVAVFRGAGEPVFQDDVPQAP
ncbi:MAG: hypothetical protein AAGA54_26435 [Myxococcota bacterium]